VTVQEQHGGSRAGVPDLELDLADIYPLVSEAFEHA
jgi:hypothetical protein